MQADDNLVDFHRRARRGSRAPIVFHLHCACQLPTRYIHVSWCCGCIWAQACARAQQYMAVAAGDSVLLLDAVRPRVAKVRASKECYVCHVRKHGRKGMEDCRTLVWHVDADVDADVYVGSGRVCPENRASTSRPQSLRLSDCDTPGRDLWISMTSATVTQGCCTHVRIIIRYALRNRLPVPGSCSTSSHRGYKHII